jgi:hypothetical protein
LAGEVVIVLSKALRMRSQLRALRYERGVTLDEPLTLPLLAEALPPPQILSGVASKASTADAEGIAMAPRCFGPLPSSAAIPLRFNHDDTLGIAGEISELSYDDDSSLLVVARCDDARALRRPAFSITACIDEYEIDERSITATVRRARLMEISLVSQLFDPGELVTSRERPLPSGEFFHLMKKRVECVQRMAAIIKDLAGQENPVCQRTYLPSSTATTHSVPTTSSP